MINSIPTGGISMFLLACNVAVWCYNLLVMAHTVS